ncbi:MAG: VOC family protein [Gammaproteobacteria bacterium]|nr:VOC family protein [Gammaproteobacteria bacterium]
MIGYVTLGTNDLPKAAEFYDKVFAGVGAKRVYDYETFVAWNVAEGEPIFSVIKPFDQSPATVGNGVMIALKVDSQALVNSLHARALEMGGQDEGAPGVRESGFYCGYFRDLDGNKLNFFHI